MSHISEEQLVLHYYAEADDEAAVEVHLAACDVCRASYREIQQALAVVSSAPVPERPPDYGSLVWKHIQSNLNPRRRAGWTGPWGMREWAFASGMAVLLVAAFLAGRYWPRPVEIATLQSIEGNVGERVLLVSAAEHLERSELVLMNLAHAGGPGEIDISGEQALARDLLEANRLYRQTAVRNEEAGLAAVLEDLERTLLDVVHSPSTIAASNLDEMQRQIESEGILFKLRVTASRIRARQNAAAREIGQRST